MRPFTLSGQAPLTATSTATNDPKTITLPKNCSACLIGAETTDARVTFDGTAPDATHGVLFKAGLQPVYVPVGEKTVVTFASTAAANSVVNVIPLA